MNSKSDDLADPGRARGEPERLRDVIVPLFSEGTDRSSSVTLDNGATATLRLDATDQDDCAAYLLSGEAIMVAGSDYVRGPKFSLYELGLLNEYDIGWYLAGANLSDIAAMGAQPLGLLSVVRYPKDLSDRAFEDILKGIRDACASVGAINVGGDIGSAERIILSASAFGLVEPSGLLTRSHAQPGQAVCLTGPTGLAGAALRLASDKGAKAEVAAPVFDQLLEKWRRVAPRMQHARIFGRNRGVTSCVDTSDGLKGAVEALAHGSGVRIAIERERIPIHLAVADAATTLGVSPLEIVFGDSVDFELVCTVYATEVAGLVRECEAAGLELHVIGRVLPGEGAVLDDGNQAAALPGEAWAHGSPAAWS